ncbi:hypothetical protein CGI33_06145 [Vibrio parahaemolyticus]|nr:hypothetical protein CGI33_06145 [Vibrio parahaemolyticus]
MRIIFVCVVFMMYFSASLVVLCAVALRTKPNSWCVGLHMALHMMLVLFFQPIYLVQYLIVTFFSSPLLIKLSTRSSLYSILFAFLPLLIATGSIAFS